MTQSQDVLELDLIIRKSSGSVRAWSKDLPVDYNAVDPREQPYRIVTTRKHTQNGGRKLLCYRRSPDGSERQTHGKTYLSEDGTWSLDVIRPAGLEVRDDFRAVSVQGGTGLEIRSRLTPTRPNAEAAIPMRKERMAQTWKGMVEIGECGAN